MKLKTTALSLAIIGGLSMATVGFTAPLACVSEATLDAASSSQPFSVTGNTCGKNLSLASICGGGNVTNGAGTAIYQVDVGATPNITGVKVVSTTAKFNPELALLDGTCSSLTGCTIDETKTVSEPGSLTVGPFDPTSQPAANSTVFIAVTDLNTESPGCGAFTLSVATLPVKLQEFSVQ